MSDLRTHFSCHSVTGIVATIIIISTCMFYVRDDLTTITFKDGYSNDRVGDLGSYTLHIPNTNTNHQMADSVEDDVLILLWEDFHSRVWRSHTHERALPCSQTLSGGSPCKCRYTIDQEKINSSTAIMTDIVMLRLKNYTPDMMPQVHKAGQYWVLFNTEFLHSHHGDHPILVPGLFNMSATYQKSADIYLPYGDCVDRQDGHVTFVPPNITDKYGAALWYVSECDDARSLRVQFAKELQKYFPVEIRGGCGPNDQPKQNFPRPYFGTNITTKHNEAFSQYKFYLSFESTFCEDYVTEKVFKIFDDDVTTVPVVRGYGPYKELLPPHSYIDVADFSTPRELANYLKELDANDTLYMEYFEWRKKTKCNNYFKSMYDLPCRVCNEMCELKRTKQDKILHNLDLFKGDKMCFYPKSITDKVLHRK